MNTREQFRRSSTSFVNMSKLRPASYEGSRLDAQWGAEPATGPALASAPQHPAYLPVKVVVEWLVAACLAVTTLPLVLLLAVLVKADSPGPALYRQRRLGKSGQVYVIFKLRTMRNNSEAATGPVWAAKEDNRVTPLGKFLRETHLDELPQIWNVLLGQMSLIGPRPERPEIVLRLEVAIPRYRERLQIRPGVTGLAQMRLPADTTIEDVRRKVAHDLYYISIVNPWLDFRLALCTAFYFLGAIAKACCKALVGKYGTEAEGSYEPLLRLPEEVAGSRELAGM